LFVPVPDIDECENTVCSANNTCVNTEGSYWCKCLPGYKHPNSKDKNCTGKGN